ncbi:hypothetical protein [Streptomyces sp. NPDC047097]|uniref:hypothetical protein n=1 Tax=Streptomyces sp. NPDC047097 TaxID=3155260 RepID=UPI0033C3803A
MHDSALNTVSPLNFTGRHIEATLVRNAKDFLVQGRAIVVNIGVDAVFVGRTPRKSIPALSSTVLVDTRVEAADALVLLRIRDEEAGIAGIVDEPGWQLLGDLLGDAEGVTGGRPFPKDTPLWKGPQDDAGRLEFDPAHLLKERPDARHPAPFDVKVNLWFAPAGTDCAIHNQHDFIEVHTQVHGTGRMQKFTAQDHHTLYEDVLMSPGYTTPDPFCATGPDGTYDYPWHQYRADTDCVWLAVEYHAASH